LFIFSDGAELGRDNRRERRFVLMSRTVKVFKIGSKGHKSLAVTIPASVKHLIPVEAGDKYDVKVKDGTICFVPTKKTKKKQDKREGMKF
jgi:antitoxin component of MazEF toxin-antitoxin module